MKDLTLLHLADLHFDYSESAIEKTSNSARQIIEHCQSKRVDIVLVAGDVWERLQPYGNRSGVNVAQKFFAELSELVGAIVIIKGNNEHDAPNSIAMLHHYRANIHAYEYNVALLFSLNDYRCIDLLRQEGAKTLETNNYLLVHGFPYPTKAGLLGEGKSIDTQNTDFIGEFSKVLQLHGMISDRYPNIPKVAMFHGNVQGTRLSNGQNLKGQEIIFPPHALELAHCDYYALGHIHLPQIIKPNMRYAGSWTNKNWGELEQKSFIELHFDMNENGYSFDPDSVIEIPFTSSRPMIKITAEFKEGKFIYENHIPKNAEVKFDYIVSENERELVTKDVIDALKKELPEGAKIEGKIIPSKRETRSEKIISAATKEEELREFARVTGEIVKDSMIEKLNEVENRVKDKITGSHVKETEGVKFRLRRLKLRGAIGIRKGIGEEEIEIDFTKFTSGLIALFGKIGRGKTTIIENLHPYRTLVSKDGSLADHFELKDSYRIINFDYGGKTYSAQIYIDGETKKQEAYLFEEIAGRNIPLNDGKVTTYDKVIDELIGSETLFFNSVFSAQKSKGISGLSAGERRELFYEILLLNDYQYYADEFKKELNESEKRLSSIEGQINSLNEEMNNLGGDTRLSLEELQVEKEQQQQAIAEVKSEIERLQREKTVVEVEIDNLRKQLEQQEVIRTKLQAIDVEIRNLYMRYDSEKQLIDEKKELSLKDLLNDDDTNELKTQQSLISKEIAQTEIDYKKQIDAINTEIDNSTGKKRSTEERIKSYNAIVERKAVIESHYQLYAENSARLKAVTDELTELNNHQAQLQNEYKEKLFELDAKYSTAKLEQETLLARQTLSHKEQSIKELDETHKARMDAFQTEIETIDKVPCGEIGRGCLFLLRAYETKDRIPEVEREYEEKHRALAAEINSIIETIKNNELQISEGATKKTTEIDALNNDYSVQLGKSKAKIDKLSIEQDFIKAELMNLSNAEEENENLKSALQGLEVELVTLDSLTELIEEKTKTLNSLKETQFAKLETLNNRLKHIKEQIDSLSNLKEEKKQSILSNYNAEIEKLKGKHAEKKAILIKDKETLEGQIVETGNMEMLINKKANLEDDIKFKYSFLAQKDSKLKAIDEQITQTKERINRINDLSKKIDDLIKRKEQVQRDVTDYAFLCKAFDKTGIPILKLENSGHEITLLANDLLSFFDSQFRIAIDTTKPTKDGKKQKEVFEISVIDDDGVTELKNKSGGQQVWIETALQLAISMFLQKTGRKIDTVFLDERDGSFDLESAYDYLRMIEQAHEKMNVYHTLLITHRAELVEMINNKISLNNGLEVFA